MVSVNILPGDMRPVIVRKTANSIQITLPADIVKRYEIKDQDEILIAYLGPGNGDPTNKPLN